MKTKIKIPDPASVAQMTETQCALTATVCPKKPDRSISGLAGRFRVQILGVHAFEINFSGRQEGSTDVLLLPVTVATV